MRALAAALLAYLVVGCGSFASPTPTPGGMDDVIAALVLRGMTVHRLVSGNPGCPNGQLHSNAVMLEVAIDNQSATHEVYLFRWRRPADFDAAQAEFDACVQEFTARHPGQQVDQMSRAPWRAFGAGWNIVLRTRLADALEAAGGT